PRSSGSLMLVHVDGSTQGSVGGGLLEARVQQAAGELFQTGGLRLLDFDMTGKEAAREGMLCGGRVRVKLEHAAPTPKTVAPFEQLAELIGRGRSGILVSKVSGPADRLELEARWVMGEQGFVGKAPAAPLADRLQEAIETDQVAGSIELAQGCFLVEPFAAGTEAVIVGAGHVAQATARLTAMTGFRTVVLDDRPEFANKERFPEADQVMVLDSFEGCFDRVGPGKNSFLVIMTRGHAHDKTVLGQALATGAGYIGMIGSTRKRTAIYDALGKEGMGGADLARVHCPVGLPIKAETPAEIAVSIVAEMILKRAELLGHAG
ncbi:MAG: XdhC family aldehyde oxidoreductase maturation factor, partial [Desulfovibrionales bacterium]